MFNVDLKEFFPSIHFGRVRGVFEKAPFHFTREVATVLAQLCCHQNGLPQGAPTSPVISNWICRGMDRELMALAKSSLATYTRYADDLTFSFTCSYRRLPGALVDVRGRKAETGDALQKIIENHRFKVNTDKVRLAGKSTRMEVTGLTVNEFPNVQRKYVRQVRSMLYAWREHGLPDAEREFNEKYDRGHRPSGRPKSFTAVVAGKLAYLLDVRGAENPTYNRLAAEYNRLVGEQGDHLPLAPPGPLERDLMGLQAMRKGKAHAKQYENIVESLLTQLLSPSLENPQNQVRINGGRKIVDITLDNHATSGFFHYIALNYNAPHIIVECKNYSGDPANPELDQLVGRFAQNRGRVGILVCRSFGSAAKKKRFLERCRDTANAGNGFVIALDDTDMALLVEERLRYGEKQSYRLLMERFKALVM